MKSAPENRDPSMLPWVVVLAGGVGTRFWPASTPTRPKQFLRLSGQSLLIEDTLRRAQAITDLDRIRILTRPSFVEPTRSVVPTLAPHHFLAEPMSRGTAPALLWAAWTIAQNDPESVMVSLHADHYVGSEQEFARTVARGVEYARAADRLLCIAVPPTRPDTGYGYIAPGQLVDDGGEVRLIEAERFVEKPQAREASEFVEHGYLWNSGMFIWRAGIFLEEVARVAPELSGLLTHLEAGNVEAFFSHASAISVDDAVLARSGRVGAVVATFPWDDLGSWDAVVRKAKQDASGNAISGQAHLTQASDNLVYSETRPIVILGADNLAVIEANGVVFVTERDRISDLRDYVESLPPELRDPTESEQISGGNESE